MRPDRQPARTACGWSTIAALVAVASAAPAVASAAGYLETLLAEMRAAASTNAERDSHRVEQARASATEQRTASAATLRRTEALRRQRDELQNQVESAEAQLGVLRERYDSRRTTLRTLFSAVRQQAHETQRALDASLVSAEHPNRTPSLAQLASGKRAVDADAIEHLWLAMLDEIGAQRQVSRFDAPVTDTRGEDGEREVLRIGAFTLLSDGLALRYLPASGALEVPVRQPTLDVGTPGADALTLLPVDTGRGTALAMAQLQPSAAEVVRGGGAIGALILSLGAIGLLIALERAVVLARVGHLMRSQERDPDTPRDNNPLGRLLMLHRQHIRSPGLGARIGELLSSEAGRMQRGNQTLKLLAAMTPLLGLLGTVTGMIAAFKSLTLFGSGDPGLMAGSIATALVTTLLGLATAVPLLLCHHLIAARSRELVDRLDSHGMSVLGAWRHTRDMP